jgi:hypothetical protein
MYPVGWCELVSHKLEGPQAAAAVKSNPQQSMLILVDVFVKQCSAERFTEFKLAETLSQVWEKK